MSLLQARAQPSFEVFAITTGDRNINKIQCTIFILSDERKGRSPAEASWSNHPNLAVMGGEKCRGRRRKFPTGQTRCAKKGSSVSWGTKLDRMGRNGRKSTTSTSLRGDLPPGPNSPPPSFRSSSPYLVLSSQWRWP